MLRTVLLGLGGFAVVLVAAAWLTPNSPGGPGGDGLAAADSTFLMARVGALESALEYERERRRDLEVELYTITEQLNTRIAQVSQPPPSMPAGDPTDERREARARMAGEEGNLQTLIERVGGRVQGLLGNPDAMRNRQLDRLVAAGFSPDRAEWVERRTEELRMDALSARYEAAVQGRALEPGELPNTDAVLRTELGEADYERYLSALNRPTSVGVGRVLASSPAERAGLLPGDQILSYGGQRVFSVSDLNALTLQGTPGQTVAVDVLRDGQNIQLYLPRGPVGIEGGGVRGAAAARFRGR